MQPTREDGFKTRAQRLAKLKKGPGVFVYGGNAHDVEYQPTLMRGGKKEAMIGADGIPVVDAAGRQVYQKANQPVLDENGRPKLGGPPKIVKNPRHHLDAKGQVVTENAFEIRGVVFPAGKPVSVGDHSLALKLRCLPHFEEVDASAAGSEDKDLSGLSKAQLVEAAEAAGLDPAGKTKAELVEMLDPA